MTRWAKAGTSQKHKKLPGDSTPWEELSKDIKEKFQDNKKKISEPTFLQQSYEESSSQKASKHKLKESFFIDKKGETSWVKQEKLEQEIEEPRDSAFLNRKTQQKGSSPKKLLIKKKKEKLEKKSLKVNENKLSNCEINKEVCSAENIMFEIKNKRKIKERGNEETISDHESCSSYENLSKKKKKHKKKEDISLTLAQIKNQDRNSNEKSICPENCFKENSDFSEEDKIKVKDLTKKLSNRKKKKLEREKRKNNPNLSLEIAIKKAKDTKLPATTKLSEKQRLEKKQHILQKRKERRKQLGIMLLPTKIENKLYRIKKALRKKNFPSDKIKEIIREERIKAQNEFRKTNTTKICFNCREWGHLVANCPKISNEEAEETGICFKCGSTEHTSSKCKKKVQGFPFASCFICKTQGHISRDCPSNTHGIYPKGGKCNLCDSINHLRKDCPTLKKTEAEPSLTLHTIDNGVSIDDELVEVEGSTKETKSKKPKVVKF